MNFSAEQPALFDSQEYNDFVRDFTDGDDLLRDNFSGYIRRRLEETNIFEKDEHKAVKKFLELL